MLETPAPVPIALLFAALLFSGCTREPSAPSALRMAVLRSNQEAKRLYQTEPFREEHGQWRAEGQQSIWQALTSSGGKDMLAKVTFDQKGHVVRVGVQMLTHPGSEPSTNLDHLLDSDTPRGIPEVMPK